MTAQIRAPSTSSPAARWAYGVPSSSFAARSSCGVWLGQKHVERDSTSNRIHWSKTPRPHLGGKPGGSYARTTNACGLESGARPDWTHAKIDVGLPIYALALFRGPAQDIRKQPWKLQTFVYVVWLCFRAWHSVAVSSVVHRPGRLVVVGAPDRTQCGSEHHQNV